MSAQASQVSLVDRFDDSVRSAGSKMQCPECGFMTPSQQKTDFKNNIRREFPTCGCHICGFDGVVYFIFDSEMERVDQEVV